MPGIHHHITTAEAALAVSICAGLLSAYNVKTGARQARWQRDRDAERRETRITVAFEHAGTPMPTGETATFLMGGTDRLPHDYRLRMVVVNSSETSTVWVRAVLVELARGSAGIDTGVGAAGPVRLEPGEPLVGDLYPERWDLDVAEGFVVKVHVAPDEWITSPVEHLMPELMHEVQTRNARGRLDGPPVSTT